MAITYTLTIDERSVQADVWKEGGTLFVRLGDRVYEISIAPVGSDGLFSLLIDGQSHQVFARASNGTLELLAGGENFRVLVERGHRHAQARGAQDGPDAWTVRSPMTGVVTGVVASAGEKVQRGSVLLILEAMKMKNELRAAHSGVIERVDVVPGQRVERGDALVHGRVGMVD